MPHRCSVPICKSTHKQGLSLLCYPKDPERRSAWLRSLRNEGMQRTNRRFVCELHFSPEQWEKTRVDGSRKLKWSAVPNILDPVGIEEALERVRATPGRQLHPRLYRPPRKRPEGPPVPALKTINKFFELNTRLESASPSSDFSEISLLPLADTGNASEESALSPDIICEEQDPLDPLAPDLQANEVITLSPITSKNLNDPRMKSVVIDTTVLSSDFSSPMDTLQSSASLPHKDPDTSAKSEQESTLQCTLPLSQKGHTIVVTMPKSRFQTRLSEDLEDVGGFLANPELTYEEKLVDAISELVQKHRLLDKKIQEIESLSKEHLNLKKQLEVHEAILIENYNLKAKLQKYEKQKFLENAMLKKKVDDNWTSIESEFVVKNGDSVKRVVVLPPNVFRGDNLNSFVSLDDQL